MLCNIFFINKIMYDTGHKISHNSSFKNQLKLKHSICNIHTKHIEKNSKYKKKMHTEIFNQNETKTPSTTKKATNSPPAPLQTHNFHSYK